MNRKITISFVLIFCFCICAHAQKLQYSRQTLQNPYAESMLFVGNIGGYHHLLFLSENKLPVISVFDSRLQFHTKKEIDFKIREDSDIRVIKFEGFYYLYVHVLKSTDHDLFKIDAQGNVLGLSKKIQQIAESDFNKSNSTLQLINQNEQLQIVAHTYFDDIKKIGSSIIQFDSDFNPVQKRKALYDFNYTNDRLQQFLLTDDHLLVLKKSRSEENGNSLDLIKVDLQSGKSVINSFISDAHLYTNAAFSLNKKDSTILVYSMLREPVNSKVVQKTIFISRLDFNLKVKTPVSLLFDQFKKNTASNFLLLSGTSPTWINMSNNLRYQGYSNMATVMNLEMNDAMNFDTPMPHVYISGLDYPKAVRFTVLNDTFKIVNDSLVANKKIFNIQPHPVARFNLKQTAYLLMVQNLTSKHKALLLVNSDENGGVTSTDVRVMNKYDCLLPQLQVIDDESVIFPYYYKNEIGLIKLTIDK